MRRLPTILVLTASMALGGVLASARDLRQTRDERDQAAVAKALAGLIPGAPTSCIATPLSTASTKVHGKTILYTFTNGDVYANDTTGGCEGGGDDILVSVEHEGRPCSGDIIRTVDRSSHIPTGSCALGQFTPYKKVRK